MTYLSIVIPAHNEQKRLPLTLNIISEYLLNKDFSIELLVIDNASTDNTFKVAKDFAKINKKIKVIKEPQKGKGFAVKKGMLEAIGDYRFLCDADLSMPIHEIYKFLPPLSNSDIVLGSREISGSIRYNEPYARHVIGRMFNLLVRLLILPQLKDTQCGFKCFTGIVAEDIFNYQMLGGWAFDVEVLHIAKLRGYSIREVPISWYYKNNSKVNPINDSITMFKEILQIRRYAREGKYYKPDFLSKER